MHILDFQVDFFTTIELTTSIWNLISFRVSTTKMTMSIFRTFFPFTQHHGGVWLAQEARRYFPQIILGRSLFTFFKSCLPHNKASRKSILVELLDSTIILFTSKMLILTVMTNMSSWGLVTYSMYSSVKEMMTLRRPWLLSHGRHCQYLSDINFHGITQLSSQRKAFVDHVYCVPLFMRGVYRCWMG